jgi:Spy/CpxP family protein refolding chaperone
MMRRTLVLALLGLGIASAGGQAEMGMPGPPFGHGPMFEGLAGDGGGIMMPLLLKHGDLSAEQNAQIHKIIDADHQTLHGLFHDLRAANDALADKLLAPGKIDPADVKPQMERVMYIRQQLMEQGLKTALAIRAVLTPEQLAKAAQIKDRLQKLRAEMRAVLEGNGPP